MAKKQTKKKPAKKKIIEKIYKEKKRGKTLPTRYNINLYKKERKQGGTIEGALLEAGCAPSTARHLNSNTKMAVIGERELREELRAKDVTIDYLVNNVDRVRDKAETKQDFTNTLRAYEGIAKFVGIGQEQHTNTTNILHIQTSEPDKLTEFIKSSNKE
jgi:hypothetical protein